jgi:hypothetical protein
MSMVVVHVASGTRDILVFWAVWPRLWATPYFAFTSPLIILLLVHLGISTLTAASGLIFRIALYILLKLAVVPDLSPVTTCLLHCKPLPKRKPLQPSLTRSNRLKKTLQWWETRENQVANQLRTVKCTAIVGRYRKANTMIKKQLEFLC